MNNLLLSSKTQGTLISTKLSCRSVFSLQFLRKKNKLSCFLRWKLSVCLAWRTWQRIYHGFLFERFSVSQYGSWLSFPFWAVIGTLPILGPKNTCPGCHLLKLWHHKAPPLFWSEGTSVLWAPVPSGWFVSAIIPWNRSGKWLQCEDRNWWQTEWGWAEGLA